VIVALDLAEAEGEEDFAADPELLSLSTAGAPVAAAMLVVAAISLVVMDEDIMEELGIMLLLVVSAMALLTKELTVVQAEVAPWGWGEGTERVWVAPEVGW